MYEPGLRPTYAHACKWAYLGWAMGVLLMLLFATPTTAYRIEHLEATVNSHGSSLAALKKYQIATDIFWQWYQHNKDSLDNLVKNHDALLNLVNGVVQTIQMEELAERLKNLEKKCEELAQPQGTSIEQILEALSDQRTTIDELDASHKEDTQRLEDEVARLKFDLEEERYTSVILKEELNKNQQALNNSEDKVKKLEQTVTALTKFLNNQNRKLMLDLQRLSAQVQEMKNDQDTKVTELSTAVEKHEAELKELQTKIEDHEARMTSWETEDNLTKIGWARGIIRQVDEKVEPLEMSLENLNTTFTSALNDTAKKLSDHEERMLRWESVDNVTRNGSSGAILQLFKDEVKPLKESLQLLNTSVVSLVDAEMEALLARNEDQQKFINLEEGLAALGLNISIVSDKVDNLMTSVIYKMDRSISNNAQGIQNVSGKIEAILINVIFPLETTVVNNTRYMEEVFNATVHLDKRLEEVEKDLQQKGPSSKAKTASFHWQVTVLDSKIDKLITNVTSITSDLTSLRDMEADLQQEFQVLKKDLEDFEANNLTARVQNLETRIDKKDSVLARGNNFLSNFLAGKAVPINSIPAGSTPKLVTNVPTTASGTSTSTSGGYTVNTTGPVGNAIVVTTVSP